MSILWEIYRISKHGTLRALLSISLIISALSPTYLYATDPYIEVVSAMQAGDAHHAIEVLEKQVKRNKRESEWYKMLDEAYKIYDFTDRRVELLQGAVAVKKVKEPETLKYLLAMALFDAERFDESVEVLRGLKQTQAVKRAIANCMVAKDLKDNALDIEITPMSDSVNTPYDNIWPFINNDKTVFYTTVVVGKKSAVMASPDIQEDIFYSVWKDDRWQPVTFLKGSIRSNENEGACCITADGRYLFFAACNRGDGGGGCELYYSTLRNGRWSRPVCCPSPLNALSWQSTPSISADGKTLYFSAIDTGVGSDDLIKGSKRTKGRIDKDIYRCTVHYNADGSLSFSDIERLGNEVNTTADEISPFITPYGNILYFSSDGHGGMGGLDIFYCKIDSLGKFSDALNLGYPVNTHRDEFGFTADATGTTGYMSCNGLAGSEFWENKRIVSFPLPQQHRTGSLFEDSGTEFVLENIYFDIDSSNIRPESFDYLDAFVQFLTVHQSFMVHITGHTDNTGTDAHNLQLSIDRALSVAAYLTTHGISPSRITTEGRGSASPVSDSDPQRNRRIEIKLERK